MKQPRIPLPPATWAEYRAGATACFQRMSPEGQQRARAFWKERPPTEPKPKRS
ncbi:hypothetical protein KB206_10820 [Microvirga sp. STS02]|uniref:hypothetical protein n=1 Tax=Hymenobacter negativus TaxID=2795026 RepID=UPI0018DD804D|nr:MULTISPECIES: hypothetical protein [Bacteria]MBH8569379.1 hypothetical protein [Hymenobacter negativus]MBR7209113.1 hypothetical protein [Microvirga sp. STS02]